MFLAANVLDNQKCSDMGLATTDSKCPKDKHLLLNTVVVFDRNGTLIGKYHKRYLFLEPEKDPSPNGKVVVLDTELGHLGLMVCFDLILGNPELYLDQVDSIIYPLEWLNEIPFLSASQYQSAWALANKVNLLASNLHEYSVSFQYSIHFINSGNPLPQYGGSGVYSGARNDFISVDIEDNQVRLVVANLPRSVRSNVTCELDERIFIVPQEVAQDISSMPFPMQPDNLFLLPLASNSNSVYGCSNGVCCKLDYKLDQTEHDSSTGNLLLFCL